MNDILEAFHITYSHSTAKFITKKKMSFLHIITTDYYRLYSLIDLFIDKLADILTLKDMKKA